MSRSDEDIVLDRNIINTKFENCKQICSESLNRLHIKFLICTQFSTKPMLDYRLKYIENAYTPIISMQNTGISFRNITEYVQPYLITDK